MSDEVSNGSPDVRDLETTTIYTHVLNRGAGGVRSPRDERCDAGATLIASYGGIPVQRIRCASAVQLEGFPAPRRVRMRRRHAL
jgi:hypothetical protein